MTSKVEFDLRGERSFLQKMCNLTSEVIGNFLKKLHNQLKNYAEKVWWRYLEWSTNKSPLKIKFWPLRSKLTLDVKDHFFNLCQIWIWTCVQNLVKVLSAIFELLKISCWPLRSRGLIWPWRWNVTFLKSCINKWKTLLKRFDDDILNGLHITAL